MKNPRASSLSQFGVALLSLLVWAACAEKDPKPTIKVPVVGTSIVTEIKTTSTKVNCPLADVGFGETGNSTITEYGICYGLKDNPTTSDTKLAVGTTAVSALDIVANLSGLTANTPYFVRGYAVYEGGIAYGAQAKFTTDNLKSPEVSTSDAADLTTTAFTIAGKITSLGTSDVTQFGHVLSTSNQTPTIADSKTEMGGTNAVPKDFKSSFGNLKANTTYYVRAYATNVTGTGYGAVKTVKTNNEQPPAVSTQGVDQIMVNAARATGTIRAGGTNPVTQYGHFWSSTNSDPKENDSKTQLGATSAPKDYASSMTNLLPNTTYYVRAYAVSAAGTAYGDVKTFKTAIVVPTVETLPNPRFNSSPRLDTDEARITLAGNVVTRGAQILEFGFVVHNSKISNPTLELTILKVLSTSAITSTNGAVFGGEIKKGDIEKLEAVNNFRAFVRTPDGVYYGANQTFAYTYPPEFSDLKFDCSGTSFSVKKYSRTPQIVEMGEVIIESTNFTIVSPSTLPTSTGYNSKKYFDIPAADDRYSIYVYNTTGKLISLLASANGRVYKDNNKFASGSLQTVCGSYPYRKVIPYVKIANGTVYYPNPPSIKPLEKCFQDCTVK